MSDNTRSALSTESKREHGRWCYLSPDHIFSELGHQEHSIDHPCKDPCLTGIPHSSMISV